MNVVIMAGGGGTRLWPLSRANKPKQFLDLGHGQTLLELSYKRAKNLVPGQNIYVATLADYADRVHQLLPDVLPANVFLEPTRRDTTAAFASIAIRLQKLNQGDVPTIFLWSDHVFTAEDKFERDLATIPNILKQHPNSVTMIGHVPISPVTSLGYIEAGLPVPGFDHTYHVKRFKEKPDQKTAAKFIAAGNFYWNMGYFSLKPDYLLSELTKYEPTLSNTLDQFAAAIAKKDEAAAADIYQKFPKQAIEYTFIEKTPNVIVVASDYGWSDVGNWSAVKEVFGLSGDFMPRGHHVHVDSENNYIYNATDKAVSLLGLKDMIVVVTDDAMLITTEDNAHRVKEVVAKLQDAGQDKYLWFLAAGQ